MGHAERHPSHEVFKGRLASNNAKAVIIMNPDAEGRILVVFKSDKAKGCTRFRTNLEGSGESVCSWGPDWKENAGNVENDMMIDDEDDEMVESNVQERQETAVPRALDPNGYVLKLAIYYDDMFHEQFGEDSATRIDGVMAVVDEMFAEEPMVEIDLDVIAVEHAEGHNWGLVKWKGNILCAKEGCPTYDLAVASPHEANIYVFFTGQDSLSGSGLAYVGTACKPKRNARSSINKYSWSDDVTALHVAHELGHNLGMWHDFLGSTGNPAKDTWQGYKTVNGVECTGYMDYEKLTFGWSACSVQDFSDWVDKWTTKLAKKGLPFCMSVRDPETSTGHPTLPPPNIEDCVDTWKEKKCLRQKDAGKCIKLYKTQACCQKSCELCHKWYDTSRC